MSGRSTCCHREGTDGECWTVAFRFWLWHATAASPRPSKHAVSRTIRFIELAEIENAFDRYEVTPYSRR